MYKPFIKIFNTINKKYFYDVNMNKIVEISEETYIDLEKYYNNQELISSRIQKLITNGYLSFKKAKKIEHPKEKFLPSLLKSSIGNMTLQVTQRCNLRCHYCAYGGDYSNRSHSELDMDIKTAKAAIKFVIERSMDVPSINIGFYGGEPMLRFDLIRECVKYAIIEAEGKEVTFNMTTNGTLFNDQNIKFLYYHNFSILISLDGPKENHNKNRIFKNSSVGSYDIIMNNIENFKMKYPEYTNKMIGFNAVLDGELDFKCASEFFNNYDTIKDFQISMSLVDNHYLDDGSEIRYNDSFKEQYSYERFKIYLIELNKLDSSNISNLFQNEFNLLKNKITDRSKTTCIQDIEHPGGPCIPCVRKMLVNVNGIIYPCERVSELSIPMQLGNVHSGIIDVEKAKKIISIGKITEDECINCWAFRDCTQCVKGADEIDTLNPSKRLKECDSVKNSVENQFKIYCTLTELGYNFTSVNIDYLIKEEI